MKKPYLNAVVAAGYIGLIVEFLSLTQNFDARTAGIIAPMTFLSTLVFSASLMAYLFLYQPVRLLIEHKPEEATKHFFSTLGTFAAIITIVVGAFLAIGH